MSSQGIEDCPHEFLKALVVHAALQFLAYGVQDWNRDSPGAERGLHIACLPVEE